MPRRRRACGAPRICSSRASLRNDPAHMSPWSSTITAATTFPAPSRKPLASGRFADGLARILALRLDVAVDELDHRQRGVVAIAEARLDDAQIAAGAGLVAGADHVEQ